MTNTTNESEAMEVFPSEAMDLFLRAFKATGLDFDDDQDNLAAARVIATALEGRDTRIRELEGALRNPPGHHYWGAGEPDCPREIKCGNGELHTLRCKVCGEDSPRNSICLAALGETANAS